MSFSKSFLAILSPQKKKMKMRKHLNKAQGKRLKRIMKHEEKHVIVLWTKQCEKESSREEGRVNCGQLKVGRVRERKEEIETV